MRFEARQTFDAPRSRVFAALTDFARYEPLVRDRVIRLDRQGPIARPDDGLGWHGHASLKGIGRDFRCQVDGYRPDDGVGIVTHVGGLRADLRFDLADAAADTVMDATLILSAEGLKARALLKSLVLSRRSLTERFGTKVAQLAGDIRARL